ncbi:cryptochrome/photolyase family protein [Nitrococcus mobilis]|uniref:DNA photolyase, Cryptochrome 1 apoprotein (Blue light photoreceptor) n=1 Tax=Nitrococcus mobilis Nb-231 TaxID=314278 RepID=A4BQ31_9GAMM|nr:deoxyribodipyrimidine photo-lyase [Nitrococcus mobilis]EAR22186.1 DNA photolyase, Cryptochrome 1 apoprotein (Blue light photoreceptor) [Nitrococcus mobilis Nb-231]
MSNRTPVLFWFRRDLRLADHPGLVACQAARVPVIPVFILDPQTEALGAAAKWRLGLAIASFRERLQAIGSDLILRRGPAKETLLELLEETGACEVHWSRNYTPDAIERDQEVKTALKRAGRHALSHPGHTLIEPWAVSPAASDHFRVYSPYWRAFRTIEIAPVVPEIEALPAPALWPRSDNLAGWRLDAAMNRGAEVVARYACVGEQAALERFAAFLDEPWSAYRNGRDRLDLAATSLLSENLTYGEISPRTIWHGVCASGGDQEQGGETFLKELVWREFSYHLLYHTPHITQRNWRAEWNAFPWRGDNEQAARWRKGLTGEPVIDAAMRQMYVTGTMHNRARMLVASYLTKHLMTHWKIGMDWFAQCLIDWDPAANALGWQWVAGSGPDAAPFFRVFNPATQAEKFDPDAVYRRRYVAELAGDNPGEAALAYFDACPRHWSLDPEQKYPEAPLIELKRGRERALEAYQHYVVKNKPII